MIGARKNGVNAVRLAGLQYEGAVASDHDSRAVAHTEPDALRNAYHLNDPILSQYWRWVSNMLTGNLGNSFFTNRPVMQDLVYRFPTTF